MAGIDPTEMHVFAQIEIRLLFGRQLAGTDEFAGVVESNQAAVEKSIEIGDQQKTIVDIQALAVGLAVFPWLNVAGSENFWKINTGYRTGILPVIQ